MNDIRRIVIVGNGFDMAHDLKTSYMEFVNKCKSEPISAIQEYDELMNTMGIYEDGTVDREPQTWYAFEKNFESIVRNLYMDFHFNGNETNIIEYANSVFSKVEKQLFEYLKDEYFNNEESVKVNLKSSIQKYVNDDTLFISFNYTDTVKLYTNNYYYVHGCMTDDECIILGFADGTTSCLQSGEYLRYSKAVKKEYLEFVRFVHSKSLEISEEITNEIMHHIDTLFSSRGEYNLPLLEDGSYDTKGMSVIVREFAEYNNFHGSAEPYDFKYVEEIVIAGHGLESDLPYLRTLGESNSIKRINLFKYSEENEEEIRRKKKTLVELWGISEECIFVEEY